MKKILLTLSAILGIYSGGWCATATFTPTLNPDTIALEVTQRKVLAALEGGGTTGTASSVSINGGNVGITGTVVVHQDGSPTATPNPTQVQQMIATLQAQNTYLAEQVSGILNAVATATPNVNIISMPGVVFTVTPDINVHGNISINTQIPTPTGSATPTPTSTGIIVSNQPTPDMTKLSNAPAQLTALALQQTQVAIQLTQQAISNLALTPWVNGGAWTPTPTFTFTPTGSATPTSTNTPDAAKASLQQTALILQQTQVAIQLTQGVAVSAATPDITKVAQAQLQLTQVSIELTQVAIALTPQVPQDSKTFALPVSLTLTGSMTDAIIVQLYNPVASGVTFRINQSTLNANVQNLVFVLGRGTSPVTVAGSCTPVAVTVTSYNTGVGSSAAATQYLGAQPTPPATTALMGYGDTGSSYNPVQWPYMFNLYAQRMMIKPGESFFIRVSGTTSSGIVYGFVLYSEQ